MSACRDFVRDFPSRCMEVLAIAERSAAARDRDVTLSAIAPASAIAELEVVRRRRLSWLEDLR